MLSHHQMMSRRLLLNVAGVTLLSAGSCHAPVETPSGAGHPGASSPPLPPARKSGGQSPSPATNPPGPPPTPGRPAPRPVTAPLFELDSSEKLIALTLDDGPHPAHTPVVLDLLRRHGIRATFFLIGENAVKHPGLVRAIADEGHYIANHTWTHPDLRHLPESQVRDELERTSDLLQATSGKPVTWFRAPSGDWSDVSLRTCAELGMRPMGWSVDPRDWSRPGTSKITSCVLEAVRPGSIVLNHDGGGDRSQTVEALRTYLPVLIGEGYRFTAPR
ncbi:polysaccharide deacetylase family protein [Kitasatospora sp. GP82]|uniref:polysaccharide deacetylase family protein n=1 Tax=Kitasatospora sp. GP82 TaxID=3035089 RepID=UPI0024763571|nr:polysaccharide deacetylase family protein [Kitasatospora sp. GP82]MDH6125285.1 peptidoglycan/xylan/chitin deacetylase (PgdA/CDA1 family) [Kitasatospora sp. GP82]